jgi:hypothetical protein
LLFRLKGMHRINRINRRLASEELSSPSTTAAVQEQ